MKIHNKVAVAATVVLGALAGVIAAEALAQSDELRSTAATASPAEATAANPVSVLRQMHVPLSPGEIRGQVDIYGDRYASGQFADGEQVTVYTYVNQQAENVGVWRLGPSDDVHKLLVGNLFAVLVTGVDTGSGGVLFPQSPAAISQETGAKLEGQ